MPFMIMHDFTWSDYIYNTGTILLSHLSKQTPCFVKQEMDF